MSETAFRRIQDLPSTHLLGAGTSMCAGCGGLQALRTIYEVLGEKTVFVNAAGCMTLLSVYPFTPFRGSWLYTSMASAPAGADLKAIEVEETCEKCGSSMVVRRGRKGFFLGCTGYPKCRGTREPGETTRERIAAATGEPVET